MPCLNERKSLAHCISVAQQALDLLGTRHDLTGEIVIADNGSTDGRQELAQQMGAGREFASEMVVKAALLAQRVVQTPVTLWPDQRGRPPHLRPWRDGWRHLRYLFMLSPYWMFAMPAALLATVSIAILATIAVGW